MSNRCSYWLVGGRISTSDDQHRPQRNQRRWYRHGAPWEVEHLYLAQFDDDAGGWWVSWSARKQGNLIYDAKGEAMATVEWVFAQGGEWVEVDPDDMMRVIGEGRQPVRP